MITVRHAAERGTANLGWLDSRHTFSFGQYYDPNHMGFGPLRLINEDRVRPGAGFETHGHRDMEIISYVLEGALEHKDSIGNGSVIRPGDMQVMSAGTGIRHSEFNPSKSEPVHFLQIWVLPDRQGLAPRYDQKTFPETEKRGRLRLVGSPDGRDGSIVIHQDTDIYDALLSSGDEKTHASETSKMFIAMNRFKARSPAGGNEAYFQCLRFDDHARDMAFVEVVLAARLAGKTAAETISVMLAVFA